MLYVKAALAVFVVTSFLGVPAYLFSQPEVTIHTIAISGNDVVATDMLEAVVRDALSGRYVYLYPRSNSLIFPRAGIEASVLHAFKRIKAANVSFEDFTSIRLEVEERKPFALWCQALNERAVRETATATKEVALESRDHEACYFLDEKGFVFSEAPRGLENAYLIYEGTIDARDPLGAQFLTEQHFAELALFARMLRDEGIAFDRMVLTEEGDFELLLEAGGALLFGKDQSLSRVLDNVTAVLSADTFQERSLDDVEYLDLRFGNKVYYKFKDKAALSGA